MKKKPGHYYTFRLVSGNPLKVDCYKWDELLDEVVETYHIQPNNTTIHGGCSCPAWRNDCKHMKCVKEAIELGRLDELHVWSWKDGVWTEDQEFHR